MFFRKIKFSSKQRFAVVLIWLALFAPHIFAQEAQTVWISEKKTVVSIPKYLDLQNGKTADELVSYALANNAELAAMRSEATAAEALVRQAGLRPNPSLEVSGTRQIGGMGDNSLMVQGALPLELGGRRGARIRVAERELEIRRLAVAERERQLARKSGQNSANPSRRLINSDLPKKCSRWQTKIIKLSLRASKKVAVRRSNKTWKRSS